MMDCGPAALKCLLDGFRIPASYARLQEACQTNVDGTSIDKVEEIAVACGLDAEQVMVPVDHVSPHALPALVVVRREGITHFVVAWRRHGRFVQLMDPARGRRWVRESTLQAELYLHTQEVPAADWREFAGSADFLGPLADRLAALQVPHAARSGLVTAAAADPGWGALATLDAATRMVAGLVRGGGLRPGRECGDVIQAIARRVGDGAHPYQLVPPEYWSIVPSPRDPEQVLMRGAVLLRIHGRTGAAAAPDAIAPAPSPSPRLARDLVTALAESPSRPLRTMWQMVRGDGLAPALLVAAAVVLAAAGAVFEMLLLRGAIELTNVITLRPHRLLAVLLLVGFVALLLLLDVAIAAGVLRLGRRIEVRLRAALLEKLPLLAERYFQCRLVSDMAQRAHSLDALRTLPETGGRFLRASMQLIFTAAGIAWLDPANAWLAALTAVLALAVPLATERMLAERELRQRTHAAALSRHYLDALLGLVAARTHGAEQALRRQHESLLVEWGRSGLHLLRGGVTVEGLQMLIGSGLAAWMVLDFVNRSGRPGGALLLVYWALNLPVLGREVASLVRQFPAYSNILARVLEPLSAADETTAASALPARPPAGVNVSFDGVEVRLGGTTVLTAVDLAIRAGEHVAVVGQSGAGKSTLISLLLGSNTATAGSVAVDGLPLGGAALSQLRRATAWVDPSVHLWNKSLYENLRYGDAGGLMSGFGSIVETARLTDLIEKLPGGLQGVLGEGGRLTSGGEGQRVRFGRALVRDRVRLALLDEPFRGLDRDVRRELLARSRQIWQDATLICVTHDIEETLTFERVLVIDNGRIVEDGHPATLAQLDDSPYAALLAAERTVKSGLWSGARWRRWRLQDGKVNEEQAGGSWTAQQLSAGR